VLGRFDARTRAPCFFNHAVLLATGYSPEELYAEPGLFERLLDADCRVPFRAALDQAARGGGHTLDVRLTHKEGRPAILQWSLLPAGLRAADGLFAWVEGSARDLTAVRTIEAVRQRQAERAALERLKSQLLANVSHELRTPLVSIKGYNDLLLRGALGPLTPRQQRSLEIAAQNTDRLVELIETLLDFARREEERLELNLSRFDLREAVGDAVSALEERIRRRGLSLTVELGERPCEVMGDRLRLTQVFRAILGNAEKFSDPAMHPGGAATIQVAVRLAGDRVEAAVSDSGIGIPEEAHARIFDRFYQVDASSTRRFAGAGLGLALARELCTMHGGEIRVESGEGRGATFTVSLPLARREASRLEMVSTRPLILVGAPAAEWEAHQASLARLGPIDLLPAHGALETLRRARRHRPDLVLVALDDAATVVAQLKGEAETSSIPVVVLAREGRRPVGRADLVVRDGDEERLFWGINRLLGRPAPPGLPPEIVIVEDELEILDFTRFLLEREGYRVVCKQSGQEALSAVHADTALCILDIALEGADGIQICQHLKSQPATREVPILIVTAMVGEEVRRASLAAGADGYLVKPFGVDQFLRQVRLHLREPRRAAEG
jgi:signal transduction histidine kinase/CheY-like chemotaxis protein